MKKYYWSRVPKDAKLAGAIFLSLSIISISLAFFFNLLLIIISIILFIMGIFMFVPSNNWYKTHNSDGTFK